MFACSVVWKQFFFAGKKYTKIYTRIRFPFAFPSIRGLAFVRKCSWKNGGWGRVIFGLWKGVGRGRGGRIVRSGAIIVSFDRADAFFRGGKLEGWVLRVIRQLSQPRFRGVSSLSLFLSLSLSLFFALIFNQGVWNSIIMIALVATILSLHGEGRGESFAG